MTTRHRTEQKIRRFRWWIVLLIILGAVAVLTHWLSKPLPPPLVSLNLVGFKVISTNTFAVISLSNAGPTRVYFDPRGWTARFQTSDGPITNHGGGFSYVSLGTKQHSNEIFYIEIPKTPCPAVSESVTSKGRINTLQGMRGEGLVEGARRATGTSPSPLGVRKMKRTT